MSTTAVVVVDDNDDADIATWRIRLTTLEGDGTVRVSLAAGLALDEVGNTSLVSAQSAAITVDNTAPTIASVTNNGTSTNQSVPVTIVLSEPLTAPPIIAVTNATPGPVTLVNALTYAVTVTATNPGPFGITSITATDLAGNVASVATGWTVGTYQTGFDVVIERGPDQELTTSASPIVFQITFDEAIDVATFTAGDLVLGGTAGGTLGLVLAADPVLSDTLFTATVTGMTTDGTVTLNLGRDLVQAAPPSGEFNTPADASAAVVTWDNPGIPVTIARGPGQNASTSVSPIVFTVTFTAPINAATFTAGDLVVGGTAGGTKLVVVAPDPGLPTTVFTATVTGMTTNGTVTLALPANLVESAVVGVFNAAADATAAEVDWVAPAGPAPPPPSPALSGGGCGVGAGAGLLVLSLGLLGLGRRRRG